MPITLNQSPALPLQGRDIKITFTPTTGNYCRMWVTAAPPGSQLQAKLDKGGSSRLQVHESDLQPFVFNADRGGTFTFLAQEYSRGGFRGGYKGDPDGNQTETKVGSEETLAIHVGQKVTFPIGTGQDESTLVVYVWNAAIELTNVTEHGEISPRIDPGSTAKAQNAAKATDVLTALAALGATATVAAAIGDLSDVLDDIIANMEGHMANPGTHTADDTFNIVPDAYKNASTQEALIEGIAACIERWAAHLVNDARDGTGPDGTIEFHAGSDHADRDNTLLAQSPGDMASALVSLADLYRSYSAHENDTDYHTAGSALPLATCPPLLNVFRAFQVELAKLSPAGSAGQQTGVALLAAIGGSTE